MHHQDQAEHHAETVRILQQAGVKRVHTCGQAMRPRTTRAVAAT